MSRRLLKALGGITAVTVTTALLGAAPAQSREPDAPPATIVVAAKAEGPDHFNSSVSFDLPPGGNAQITSPSLDNTMTKAKVEFSTDLSDEEGFENVATALLQAPTPGKRLLTCIMLVQDAYVDESETATVYGQLSLYEASAPTLMVARMLFCLRVSILIAEVQAEQNAKVGRQAGTPCGQAPVGVKEKVRKEGGSFFLKAKGAPNTKPKNARVKIKCKVLSPTKFVMTIKPKKKGKTLRSVLGTNLRLGIASPSSATEGAKIKVAFKAP